MMWWKEIVVGVINEGWYKITKMSFGYIWIYTEVGCSKLNQTDLTKLNQTEAKTKPNRLMSGLVWVKMP